MKKLDYKKYLKLKEKNKGITLIALIVTIIIVLILASVSVAVFSNNNIIKKSKFAGETYQNKINEEEKAMQNYASTMNEYTIADNGRDTITIDKEEYENLKSNCVIFINTSKLLANISDIQSAWTTNSNKVNTSYTATQNCAITGWIASCGSTNARTPSNSQGIDLKVNDVTIQKAYYSGNTSGSVTYPITIYLKQGDTFSLELKSEMYKGYLNVFALK